MGNSWDSKCWKHLNNEKGKKNIYIYIYINIIYIYKYNHIQIIEKKITKKKDNNFLHGKLGTFPSVQKIGGPFFFLAKAISATQEPVGKPQPASRPFAWRKKGRCFRRTTILVYYIYGKFIYIYKAYIITYICIYIYINMNVQCMCAWYDVSI